MAPILGLETISQYDVSAKCPFCSSHSWQIFQDPKTLEEHHYCFHCKASGSVLAMAAQLLELSIQDTLRHLSDKLMLDINIDVATHAYMRSIQQYQDFEQFWTYAQQNMQRLSMEQRQAIFELRWHTVDSMSPERFMRGPGRLYGIIPHKLINEYVPQPFSGAHPQVVVLPFYRSPKQLSSFLCVTPQKEILYSNTGKGLWHVNHGDTGFAGLQFLTDFRQSQLLVTSMLNNMVQLQMHHFNVDETPLALLGWRQPTINGKQRQWVQLGDRDLILWESQLTLPVIQQAIMLNARISTIGPAGDPKQVKGRHWYDWLHRQSALDLHRQIVKTAEPVDIALAKWSRTLTEADKVRLLNDSYKLNETVFQRIRKIVDPRYRAVPSRVVQAPLYTRSNTMVYNGHTTVIERDGKWYGQKGNVRFPGIIRVTHIIVRPGQPKEYIGYILVNKKKLEFRFCEPQITWQWFWNFLRESNIYLAFEPNQSMMVTKSDLFNPLDVACRFSAPEILTGQDRLGWNGTKYQFKNYSIEQGRLTPNPPYLFTENVPGPRTEIGRITNQIISMLNIPCRELELVWGFAIGLAAQITAESVGLYPLPVTVVTEQKDIVHHMFSLFELQRGPASGWNHRWPRVLLTRQRLGTATLDNYFVHAPLALDGMEHAIYIKKQHVWLDPRKLSPALAQIIPNYLLSFSQQPPVDIIDYNTLLKHTYKMMRQTFPFLDEQLLHNAFCRVVSI